MNQRFLDTIALIDAENGKDPRIDHVGGEAIPRELLYSKRLTEWILRLNPQASEALLLAARSQHIRRWEISRDEFPDGKAGYHQWKNALKKFHAQLAENILRKSGWDETTISRVRALNLKSAFPVDPESRTLEDALCLVFLEYQFGDLVVRADSEKVVNALRKSWKKMTSRAREAALTLPYSDQEKSLLERALDSHQADS